MEGIWHIHWPYTLRSKYTLDIYIKLHSVSMLHLKINNKTIHKPLYCYTDHLYSPHTTFASLAVIFSNGSSMYTLNICNQCINPTYTLRYLHSYVSLPFTVYCWGNMSHLPIAIWHSTYMSNVIIQCICWIWLLHFIQHIYVDCSHWMYTFHYT